MMMMMYPNIALHAILVVALLAQPSEQQQNRRSQSQQQQQQQPQASDQNLNNQAINKLVSSNSNNQHNQAQQATAQRQPTANVQTRAQQVQSQPQTAQRKPQVAVAIPQQPRSNNHNNNKPLDPDSENEDQTIADFKFECPRPDGLFADPSSCKKFILCGSSHPWQQTCPPGLYFDSKLKFCTFKTSSLTCGPVSDEEEVRQDEATQEAQDSLPVCDSRCQLPDCFCSPDGTTVPGNLQPNQVPQMILLSFSGAVNEMVFDHYKKILGYSNKYGAGQSRLNPNGCGIKATFFVSHEYSNYAQVHWLAAQSHEIALHSITHRLPEIWWTDKANYSEWVEEIIGMREIVLQLTNINGDSPVIKREDIVGMRAPYIKPGGDSMYQMVNDFGLLYSSSIVAPKSEYPLWPFTLDSKVPFDCANVRNNKQQQQHSSGSSGQSSHRSSIISENNYSDGEQSTNSGRIRVKRQSTFAGKSLKCPTKSYPGVWEVPLNPLTNEISTCHHLDQCVFPSQDDHMDSSDIVNFLIENFERHYNTTRAPFQINLHVQWVLNANRVRALTKFIDHVSKAYPNVWFVSFRQMVDWLRAPMAASSAIGSNAFKCDEPGRVKMTSCNRPQTCVVKLNTDNDYRATTQEQSKKSDARYLQLCPGVQCPKTYPWFGNILGSERQLKSVLDMVQESNPTSSNAASTGQAGESTQSQPQSSPGQANGSGGASNP